MTWTVCCYTVADMNSKTGDSGETTPTNPAALTEAADRVLQNLAELEPQLINAGIFDQKLNPVALTSDSGEWPTQASVLLGALEAGSGDEKLDSAHVASTEGEVFVVTESGLSLVAVTSRFVLASLTSYDMRMSLRDAARSAGMAGSAKAMSEAKKPGVGDA